MFAHTALAGYEDCYRVLAGWSAFFALASWSWVVQFADFLFPEVALVTETDALAAAACQPRCTTDDSRKVHALLRRSLEKPTTAESRRGLITAVLATVGSQCKYHVHAVAVLA